jgi:putative membrane protein insertion efficiency factor
MKLPGPPTHLFWALLLALSLLLFVDLSRIPEEQFTVKILVLSIEKYHEYVSPHFNGIVTCKFTPSCSSYAIMALKQYGAFKGTLMTIKRLIKCSPLSSAHGEDYP